MSFFGNVAASATIVASRRAISCAIRLSFARASSLRARKPARSAGPGLHEAGAIQGRDHHLLAHGLEARKRRRQGRHRARLHLRRLQARECLLEKLQLFAQLQPEETPQPGAVLPARLVRVVEDFDRAVIPVVDQRRKADERHHTAVRSASLELHQIRQLTEVPVADVGREVRSDDNIGACGRAKARLHLLAQFGTQLCEVAAHRRAGGRCRRRP